MKKKILLLFLIILIFIGAGTILAGKNVYAGTPSQIDRVFEILIADSDGSRNVYVDGFGGLWLCENQEINIAITNDFKTDISEFIVVKHRVKFSYNELRNVHKTTTKMFMSGNYGISNGHLDIINNRIVINFVHDGHLDDFMDIFADSKIPLEMFHLGICNDIPYGFNNYEPNFFRRVWNWIVNLFK